MRPISQIFSDDSEDSDDVVSADDVHLEENERGLEEDAVKHRNKESLCRS